MEEKEVKSTETTVSKNAVIRFLNKLFDWSNPNAKRFSIVTLSVIIVAVSGISMGALVATNSTKFCGMCHEMTPEAATHMAGPHEGIPFSCAECHVPPDGFIKAVEHKIYAMKEVYYHITGLPNPIVLTAHEAIPNRTCEQEECHGTEPIVVEDPTITFDHEKHLDQGMQCINCHSGVEHGKIAERGLTSTEELEYWEETEEMGEAVAPEEYRTTNMGTCIECHASVNAGQEPWKDVEYALPYLEDANEHDRTVEDEILVPEEFANVDTDVMQHTMQQAVGVEEQGTISMECETCHLPEGSPVSHQAEDWESTGHGEMAAEDNNECMDCHVDQNWLRRFPEQDMDKLLAGEYEEEPSSLETPEEMAEATRENAFCASCHESVTPASHDTEGFVKNGHKDAEGNPPDVEECYTCHDYEAPASETEQSTASSDLYCSNCHENDPSTLSSSP